MFGDEGCCEARPCRVVAGLTAFMNVSFVGNPAAAVWKYISVCREFGKSKMAFATSTPE